MKLILNLADMLSFRRTNVVMYTLEQRWDILRHYFSRFWQKKKTIFSDEAHFDLGGYVKSICRIRGTENPHAYTQNE